MIEQNKEKFWLLRNPADDDDDMARLEDVQIEIKITLDELVFIKERLKEVAVMGTDYQNVKGCVDTAERLQGIIRERMGRASSAFRDIQQRMREERRKG